MDFGDIRAAVWKHGLDLKAQDLRSAFRCRLSAFGRFQASSCCLGVVGGSLFTLSTVRCELVGLANRQMGCAWMKLQAPFLGRVRRQDLGVSQNYGYLFGGPNNKDYSILGSTLGFPYFGKLPFSWCETSVRTSP